MLNHKQKESIINAVWSNGTLEAASKNLGINLEAIHDEIKKSAVFKKRIKRALEESKGMLIDEARALVRDYMRGEYEKTDRNRLTAAIALLNAYEPGFKGVSKVEGRVEHDIRVITSIPRPQYKELEPPKIKVLPKRTVKRKILDDKGNLIGIKAEIVEGEIIEEEK